MPTTPTLALMDMELAVRVGRPLALAGLFALSADGSSPVCRIGLRKAIKKIGVFTSSALTLYDSDIQILSFWAIERVLDEAELYALEQVILGWYRAVQAHMEAVETSPTVAGWLYEAKQSIKARIAELKAICSENFEEPTGPLEVGDSTATLTPPRPSWPFAGPGNASVLPSDATLAIPTYQIDGSAIPSVGPGYGWGYGLGGWGW